MKSLNANASTKNHRAFTFVEVLASMLFIAIVIPVAIQGIRMASEAGTLAQRKSTALQLGESLLQEMIVTDVWQSTSSEGKFEAPWEFYTWELETSTWEIEGLHLLTLKVSFPIREQDYAISMTTLATEPTE